MPAAKELPVVSLAQQWQLQYIVLSEMCFYETVKINIFILPKADILRNYAEFKIVIQTAVTILVSELFNFCDMIVGFYG